MSLQEELGLQNPFIDIRHEAVLNIVRTSNLLSLRAAQIFRGFDLTEAQFNVLFSLHFTKGNVTQAELGKRLVVTRASITSVLDKLEAKGLVRRAKVAGNRRIHHVIITPEGTRVVQQLEPPYRMGIHLALAGMEDEGCRHLIGELEEIRERLRQMMGNGELDEPEDS